MSFDLSGRIAVAIKRICLLRRLKEGTFIVELPGEAALAVQDAP